jgi:hypothetical protein
MKAVRPAHSYTRAYLFIARTAHASKVAEIVSCEVEGRAGTYLNHEEEERRETE